MIDDVPPQKIVPPFAVVRTEKTNVLPVNKPVVTKNVVQKTYDPMPNKGGFKINPGKEFQVELHFLKLTPMPICEKVSELSSDGKGGKWEYNVFCEG